VAPHATVAGAGAVLTVPVWRPAPGLADADALGVDVWVGVPVAAEPLLPKTFAAPTDAAPMTSTPATIPMNILRRRTAAKRSARRRSASFAS